MRRSMRLPRSATSDEVVVRRPRLSHVGVVRQLQPRYTRLILREHGITLTSPAPQSSFIQVVPGDLLRGEARRLHSHRTLLDDLASWIDVGTLAWTQRYAVATACRILYGRDCRGRKQPGGWSGRGAPAGGGGSRYWHRSATKAPRLGTTPAPRPVKPTPPAGSSGTSTPGQVNAYP